MMDKENATQRLGGTEDQAARWIGVSTAVYREWPERLLPVMTDRVYAAIIRRQTAKALGMTARQFFADWRGETVIESMLERVSMSAIMANLMHRVPPEFEQREERTPRKRPARSYRTNDAEPAAATAG